MSTAVPAFSARPVIVVHSHPIQYFAPLYAQLAQQGVRLNVWYCSDESVRGSVDKEFGTAVKWDIPLLEGYDFRFLRNFSWKPSIHNGFWGLINLGILFRLLQQPRSIVIVPGWNFCSYLLAIFFGKLFGHQICLRAETPLHQEARQPWRLKLKKFLIGRLLFSFVDRYLYIGQHNRDFYQYMGVNNAALSFSPYAVDNTRFQHAAQQLASSRALLRQQLGIPANAFVILTVGKYISKKRPFDLLRSFHQLAAPDTYLVMVGSGELKEEMEQYIHQHQMNGVQLTGFINQQRIAEYYALADLFVLVSGRGETWGLAVNEAMNFALPILVSDTVGCAPDLVQQGHNGFVFETGNLEELTKYLNVFTRMPKEQLRQMGQRSLDIVRSYNYETTVSLFKPAV